MNSTMTTNTHGLPVALPGAEAETLMWAHPHEVEPQALDQLRNISRLPSELVVAQTAGVECRKDAGVVDEIPGACKDLGAVIEAQDDLVEVVARLTTLMCVKG